MDIKHLKVMGHREGDVIVSPCPFCENESELHLINGKDVSMVRGCKHLQENSIHQIGIRWVFSFDFEPKVGGE